AGARRRAVRRWSEVDRAMLTTFAVARTSWRREWRSSAMDRRRRQWRSAPAGQVVDSSVFFGGSVVAAVIAGSVALFAPCCISVMLPSYFATAFQNRRQLVAMTFLFAAGVATVILPIALGAAAVQRFMVGQHTVVYTV